MQASRVAGWVAPAQIGTCHLERGIVRLALKTGELPCLRTIGMQRLPLHDFLPSLPCQIRINLLPIHMHMRICMRLKWPPSSNMQACVQSIESRGYLGDTAKDVMQEHLLVHSIVYCDHGAHVLLLRSEPLSPHRIKEHLCQIGGHCEFMCECAYMRVGGWVHTSVCGESVWSSVEGHLF